MRIERLQSGRYEAITNLRDFKISLNDWTNIGVSLSAYGDTHFEAIQNCLKKVDRIVSSKLRLPTKEIEEICTNDEDNTF